MKPEQWYVHRNICYFICWAVLAEGKWSFAYWDLILIRLVHTNTGVCSGPFRDSELQVSLTLMLPASIEGEGPPLKQTNKQTTFFHFQSPHKRMAVDSLANLHQKVAQISPNSIFTVDVDFYLEWHFFITSHDSHKDWRLIRVLAELVFWLFASSLRVLEQLPEVSWSQSSFLLPWKISHKRSFLLPA